MKRTGWLAVAVALVLLAGSLPAAAELKVSAPVAAVTVYPDRAQVTRRVEVQIPVGDEVVVIEGLPAGLDVSTASVRGDAPRPVRLAALEFQRVPLATVPDAQIEALRTRIRDLERQQAILGSRVQNVDAELKMLHDLMKFETARVAEGLQTRPMPPAEIEAIVKTIRERMDRNRDEYYDLQRQQFDLKEKLDLARRELNQLQQPQRREQLVARIPVSATRATPAVIELTYIIGGASWGAAYEIRALTGESQVAIRYDARISQRTGEDWTNAEVTLSTAAPALGASAPEPNPITLYVPAPAPPAASPRPMAGARASAIQPPISQSSTLAWENEEGAGMEDAVELQLQTATASSGTTVTYRIPGKVSIPSDNTEHRYAIGEQSYPVEFRYRAVPRTRDYGYLVAETRYQGELVLLPGPASIFQDQSFVGQIQMGGVAAGDTLTLQFGPDRRVALARQDVEVKRDSSGFSRRREIVYRSILVVANHRDRAVGVTLVDRVPTTSVEDVKIEIDYHNPQPDLRRTDGLCIWRLTLAPNEERRIPFVYTVTYPEEVALQGME